jgi:hypothetical protein
MYCGRVECVTAMGLVQQVTVRVGDASVRIFDGRTDTVVDEVCRFDIDPDALQVWPLE